MKKEVPLSQSLRLINSGNVILVTSSHEDKANIVTLAWSTPVSRTPALAGISVAGKHLSNELIKKSKEFIINIPSFDLLEQVVYCGSHSGRQVDKFSATELSSGKANCLDKTPLINECIGHLECRVRDIYETGDHTLFIAEVMHACAKEGFFKDIWDITKAKLIYHLGGKFFASPEKMTEI
ncbi:flavin reductase family protein [Candidatus Omnitrophota bacterium]